MPDTEQYQVELGTDKTMIYDIIFPDGDIQEMVLEITTGIPAPLNEPDDILSDVAVVLTIPAAAGGGGGDSFTFFG